MIQAASFAVPQSPASLESLSSLPATRGLKGVQLQTPSGNAGAISYGGNGAQPFALAAGATSEVLPIAHLNDLHVSSTNGTDTLTILVFL